MRLLYIKAYKDWIVLVIVLLLIFFSGWIVFVKQTQKELEYNYNQSKNEAKLVSTLIQERLQKHDYQLAVNFINDWATNSPDIVEITLYKDNGFEFVSYKSPLQADNVIVEEVDISYSYEGMARLKIIKSIDEVYADQKLTLYQLLCGYFFIALVFCFLVYTNRRTKIQKKELVYENKRRKESEESYIREKEKAEASAISAKKHAAEKDKINIELESEVNERLKAENDLKNLNDTLEEKVLDRTAELKKLNAKIGDIARSSGMAEVATGVLHNVGNVLNSVNVSVGVIREKINKTKACNLSRVVSLLEDNKENLAEFIVEDERGKQIPEFLCALGDQLDIERENLINELGSLTNNLEHINNIIHMQQSYAGNYGVSEHVSLPELVEDAIKINMDGIDDHNVEVIRAFSEVPVVSLDKHKLLQVIINLVSNAKHAVIESGVSNKKLFINIRGGDKSVIIEVKDNGVGIKEEDMPQLFVYGFKKRLHGHGFGLHNSALVAKELNAEIKAYSEGLGKGATFTLELDLND